MNELLHWPLVIAFMEGLGGPEMLLVFVIILVLFGGQKLPEFARGAGKIIREFKKASSGVEEEFKRALDEDEQKKKIQATLGSNPSPVIAEAPKATPETPVSPTPPRMLPHDHNEPPV